MHSLTALTSFIRRKYLRRVVDIGGVRGLLNCGFESTFETVANEEKRVILDCALQIVVE